jgi:lambda family phage minor tail protein L
MTIVSDVQQSWHDGLVELFDLDLQPITGDPADKFYFTNQLKPNNTKIQWKGNTYEPLPIIAAGYEKNTIGQIAQPTLTVANVLGTFTQVISGLDDLVGAKVTRRRTFGKYLDGEPSADPLQEFPLDVFYIERKTQDNSLVITWELASALDLEGIKLPRRIITQNYCQWRYRGSECGYTGPILYGSNDQFIDTTGLSAAGVTVINAGKLVLQRQQEQVTAKNLRDAAIGNKNKQCETRVLLEERFNYENFVSGNLAFWGGTAVKLNATYRAGKKRADSGFGARAGQGVFEIERWGVDPTACSIATAQLVTARANLVTANNNVVAAQNALNAAIAALPSDDPLRLLDVCGKRVNSCKLRFPKTSLPYGGFPGANTVRQ